MNSKCRLCVLLLCFLSPVSAYSAAGEGPGMERIPIVEQGFEQVGVASVWNTRDSFQIRVDPIAPWKLSNIRVYLGTEEVPVSEQGKLIPGKFNYKIKKNRGLLLELEEDLGVRWGVPFEDNRQQTVSIHAAAVNKRNRRLGKTSAWAYTGPGADTEAGTIDQAVAVSNIDLRYGWSFAYTITHPQRGHFIDAPVGGLSYYTPTGSGITDESGGFDFFPGEKVTLSLGNYEIGTTEADIKISPLDFYPIRETGDASVVNMARMLQSFDSDADPANGITLDEKVVKAFKKAMKNDKRKTVDFQDSDQIDKLIDKTITFAGRAGISLAEVTAEDAKEHLDSSLSSTMFRKNVSRTPELASSKSKMAISDTWFPALAANADGSSTAKTLEYYDENGALIRTMDEAHPIVVSYTDAHEETGASDTWAAVSLDDGETWKRTNLSRSADREAFNLANGEVYYGDCKKPVIQVKGNKIMVAWTSKFAKGGKPRYAIDPEDDYTFDDSYYNEDIWGVGGPQRSHDYTEDDFPEVGEVPYSAVWIARGVICDEAELAQGLGDYIGDIVWFKPERLTSARRDALQIFMGAAKGAGFAMVWQEDPEGLRPGKEAGPGPGWGGATTNHKTDIWYSFVNWGDFNKVDMNFAAGGDPEHDLDVASRPKTLVPMSLPVRLSDNDVVNTENIRVELGEDGLPLTDSEGNYIPLAPEDGEDDSDGTHRYALEVDGLLGDWVNFTNNEGELKTVARTQDGRLLDGDTGASRGNIFLQTYQKYQKGKLVNSAWAIITYEETKGLGSGPDEDAGGGQNDDYVAEEGKNVIYHSFDFRNPDLCSGGGIVNLPERDENGNLLYLADENGTLLPDYQNRPQLAYENARRGRFLPQGIGAINLNGTRTAQLMVYKEGPEGSGRPSDIMLRRWVVPEHVTTLTGNAEQPVPHNPYRFENLVGNYVQDDVSGQWYWEGGVQNMSSVTPLVMTDSEADPDKEDAYGAVKVVTWEQTEANLSDRSSLNPYDDARAHRGAIRGDFVTVGFTHTANWAAARNGNDKFDFYIRRSFDGGQTWTTAADGEGVEHCRTWTWPSGTQEAGDKEEVCNTYGPGQFEAMRNLSHLPNANETVIEPRIVAVPGTYKIGGDPSPDPEDIQDDKVFYVAYGTSTNPKKDPVTGEQEAPAPADLYYSFTQDAGEHYALDQWNVNPDSDGTYSGEIVERWAWMAKGDQKQGEVQLRMTPDGSKFYASWLDEGGEGSDIMFRRILPYEFLQNRGTVDN
jgi:hypothetical protein